MPVTLPPPQNRRCGWIALLRPGGLATGTYGWHSTAVGSRMLPPSGATLPATLPFTLSGSVGGQASSTYGWTSTARGQKPGVPAALLPAVLPFTLGPGGPPLPLTLPFVLGGQLAARQGTASSTYGWISAAVGHSGPTTSALPATLPIVLDS